MHPLLDEQVRRHFGDINAIPAQWRPFLASVDAAFQLIDAEDRTCRETLARKSGALEGRSEETHDRDAHVEQIADTAPVMLWMTDAQARNIYSNPALLEFTGRSQEQLRGAGWMDLIHPDDRRECREHVAHVVANREGFSHEHRKRRADGMYRWVLVRGEPRLSPGGTFEGYTGSCVDITERHEVEQSLRGNEARLRLIMEQMPAVLWTIDADLRFTSSAGLGLNALNHAPGQVVGTTLWEYFRTTDHDFVAIAAHRRALKGEAVTYSMAWGGNEYETHVEPLRDHSGLIIGCIGLALDVTDRRRAERALETQLQQLNTLFRVAESVRNAQRLEEIYDEALEGLLLATKADRAAILLFDPHQVMRFKAWRGLSDDYRRAVEGHTPWSADARDPLPVLVPDVGEDATLSPYRALILGEGIRALAFVPLIYHQRLLGKFMLYYSSVHEFTTNEIQLAQAIATTVAGAIERRRAEEALSRAKRLETAGLLAGQIAHDFNNLLSPLVAYPELLRARLPDDPRIHRLLDDMEQAAQQIAEINQQLLTLGRRGHYQVDVLNLNALVESSLRSPSIPPTVVVQTDLTRDIPSVRGGSAQITRMFSNLLTNAVEAMGGIGTLTVRTRSVRLEQPLRRYAAVNRGEYVRVDIIDAGAGISEEIADRVFEPFFTTKKADRRRGSGLGLSVVHSVMEDHDGYVDLESAVGLGTTFSLYFPVERLGSVAIVPDSQSRSGKGERILVVDDDPLQLRIARTALEQLGYEVATAASGAEALGIVNDQRQDLVILDMIMDEIDGTETLRRIRAIDPDQPALIVSGYAPGDRVSAALAMGGCEFLPKPIQVSGLARAVRSLLDKRLAVIRVG